VIGKKVTNCPISWLHAIVASTRDGEPQSQNCESATFDFDGKKRITELLTHESNGDAPRFSYTATSRVEFLQPFET